MRNIQTAWTAGLGGLVIVAIATGCSHMDNPATAKVAVSAAEVDNAAGAGGGQYAPLEMNSAREKMALAQKAMLAKNYPLAETLAAQAMADAKLARSKANSAKAQAAADALQDDLRALRDELARTSK